MILPSVMLKANISRRASFYKDRCEVNRLVSGAKGYIALDFSKCQKKDRRTLYALCLA